MRTTSSATRRGERRRSLLARLTTAAVAAAFAATSLLTVGAPASAATLPFAVTSPEPDALVDSTTPTFTGTGTTGDRVEVQYQTEDGPALAGSAVIDEEGAWTTATDFGSAPIGDTEIEVTMTEITPDDSAVASTEFVVRFSEPPVPIVTDFAVTYPAIDETVDPADLHYEGTGVPGNTIRVSYRNTQGALVEAGSGRVLPQGIFIVPVAFSDLPADQLFADTITTEQLPSGAVVGEPIERRVAFSSAPIPVAPFVVLAPQDGETIDTATPDFTGTGEPGDTVQVTYEDFAHDGAIAGETAVDENGEWTLSTGFSAAPFDVSKIEVTVGALSPAGVERPGERTLVLDFSEPPRPAAPFSVTSPADGASYESNLSVVEFTGTGVAGSSIDIQYDFAGSYYSGGRGTVGADGTWRVQATFRESLPGSASVVTYAYQVSAGGELLSAGVQTTILFERVEPLPPLVVVSPQDGALVHSVSPAYTGTGTAGDTITVSYEGRSGDRYAAGETLVDENGDWTIASTDFSDAEVGQTRIETDVQTTSPGGEKTEQAVVTVVFPYAPAVRTLEAPTNVPPSVSGAIATFSGTGTPGATIEVAVTTAPAAATTRALARLVAAPTTLTTAVLADGTWTVSEAFEAGSYSATATQFTATGADRSAPSATVRFSVAAVLGPTGPDDVVSTAGPAAGSTGSAQVLAATGTDFGGTLAFAASLLVLGILTVGLRRHRGLRRF